MWSRGKGCLSAVTKVKVLSPEINIVTQDQGIHSLEVNIRACVNVGEYVTDVSGSKSTAGKRTVYIGTWENHIDSN